MGDLVLKVGLEHCTPSDVDPLKGSVDVGWVVREATALVFKRLAQSPNFSTGGAMQRLIRQMHAVAAEEDDDQGDNGDRQAKSRDVIVEVSRSAADELIDLLRPAHGVDLASETRVIGYALKTISQICTLNGAEIFVAPFIQNDGVVRLHEVLEYIQALEITSFERWRTHSRVAQVLVNLVTPQLEGMLPQAFQRYIKESITEDNFVELLCRLPERGATRRSRTTFDRERHLASLRADLVLLYKEEKPEFPETAESQAAAL